MKIELLPVSLQSEIVSENLRIITTWYSSFHDLQGESFGRDIFTDNLDNHWLRRISERRFWSGRATTQGRSLKVSFQLLSSFTGVIKLPIFWGSNNANVRNFDGFPRSYCLVWVGYIMTPVSHNKNDSELKYASNGSTWTSFCFKPL